MTDQGSTWAAEAVVHGTAYANSWCVRCDEPITAGEANAWVPGLDRRGPAHPSCLPSDHSHPPTQDSSPGSAPT